MSDAYLIGAVLGLAWSIAMLVYVRQIAINTRPAPPAGTPEALTWKCPQCSAVSPLSTYKCSTCGYSLK